MILPEEFEKKNSEPEPVLGWQVYTYPAESSADEEKPVSRKCTKPTIVQHFCTSSVPHYFNSGI